MKKLLTIIAAVILVIGLVAGCGSSKDGGSDKKTRHYRFFRVHFKQSVLRIFKRRC